MLHSVALLTNARDDYWFYRLQVIGRRAISPRVTRLRLPEKLLLGDCAQMNLREYSSRSDSS